MSSTLPAACAESGTSAGSSSHSPPTSAVAADEPPPIVLARPFRSRKNRPCDGCRRAKTRCAITQVGTPCVECQHTRKKCTFDELPRERKKPTKRTSSPQDMDIDTLPQAAPTAPTSPTNPAKRARTTEDGTPGTTISLEDILGYHALTAVLTDDLLPIGARTSGPGSIRQISVDSSKPQYVIFGKRVVQRERHRPELFLQPVLTALSLLRPAPSPRGLMEIYLTVSNAAFPVLPPSSAPSAGSAECYPAPILAKVYRAGLNHIPGGQQRASARSIGRLSEGSDMESGLHRSSLAGLSDALLWVSARPANDCEDAYLVLAKAIAQAQLMGLHMDPTTWDIPASEKDFRRVLWWTLRVHDAWSSFLYSRPSHIQTSNHNVPLPTLASILTCTMHISTSATLQQQRTNATRAAPWFQNLCRLSVLASRLQTQICTLMTPKEDRLDRVVEIENEVETLLKEVRSKQVEEGPGYLSFMTTLLGFRCMLRRIAIELSIGLGAPFTPDPDTLERYAQAVEWFVSIDGAAFDGFWLVHVGHILSSVTSSLIRLSLAMTNSAGSPMAPVTPEDSQGVQTDATNSPPHVYLNVDERTNPIFLLCHMRCALQKAKDMHWDLAEAAIARADNVALCLENIGEAEYGDVVLALRGMLFMKQKRHNGGVDLTGRNGVRWNVDMNLFAGTGMDHWPGFEEMSLHGIGYQPTGLTPPEIYGRM